MGCVDFTRLRWPSRIWVFEGSLSITNSIYGVSSAGSADDWPVKARRIVEILIQGLRALTDSLSSKCCHAKRITSRAGFDAISLGLVADSYTAARLGFNTNGHDDDGLASQIGAKFLSIEAK
jgi:hypothetical protein